VTLVDWDPEGEVKVVAAMLYPYTNLPETQVLDRVRQMSFEDRMAVVRSYVGERSNRRHKPGRALERTDYRFDVVSDYGAFRDLQRHRTDDVEWQELTPPRLHQTRAIDDAGLGTASTRRWIARRALVDLSERFPDRPLRRVLAYRIRYVMQFNAREAMHLIELRTSVQGHPSYPSVGQEMHRLIAEQAGHRRHRRGPARPRRRRGRSRHHLEGSSRVRRGGERGRGGRRARGSLGTRRSSAAQARRRAVVLELLPPRSPGSAGVPRRRRRLPDLFLSGPVSDDRPPIEQVLDVVLYAPLGVALEVQRRIPEFVRDGRRQAEQRVVLARFIGKMAVHVGRQELDKRIAAMRRPTPGPSAVVDTTASETSEPSVISSTTHTTPTATTTDAGVAPGDLPIAGYDSLSASQVVGRLSSLTIDELDAVEAYETANRRRRTIVAKVAQLRTRSS
jgi:hypothetical protein